MKENLLKEFRRLEIETVLSISYFVGHQLRPDSIRFLKEEKSEIQIVEDQDSNQEWKGDSPIQLSSFIGDEPFSVQKQHPPTVNQPVNTSIILRLGELDWSNINKE